MTNTCGRLLSFLVPAALCASVMAAAGQEAPVTPAAFGVSPGMANATAPLQRWLASGRPRLSCEGVFNTGNLVIEKPVSITAGPKGCTLKVMKGASSNGALLTILGAKVSLSGISIDQSNATGDSLGILVSRATEVRIANATITNPHVIGIVVAISSGVTLENIQVRGVLHEGAWGLKSVDSQRNIYRNITGYALPNRLMVAHNSTNETFDRLHCRNKCVAAVLFLENSSSNRIANITSDGTPDVRGDDAFVLYGNSSRNTISNVSLSDSWGIALNLTASEAGGGAPSYNMLTNITIARPGEDCVSFFTNGTRDVPMHNTLSGLRCTDPSRKKPGVFSGVSFVGAQFTTVRGAVTSAGKTARFAVSEARDSRSQASPSANNFVGTATGAAERNLL